MTIAILKLELGQKIPRPFSRACSTGEMVELITSWAAHHPVGPCVKTDLRPDRVGTEDYVYRHGATKFYAFNEF